MYYPPLEGYVLVKYYITSMTCPNSRSLSLVKILYKQIQSQPLPSAGVEVPMYDWSEY